MSKPICPICGEKMIIDEWNGWCWECIPCDYQGRDATNKEIAIYETELDNFADIDE